jgi:CBS domain-containing protein
MRVDEVMSREVVTVGMETSAKQAVRALASRSITAAPVVDDGGGLVGIVAEGDLLAGRLATDPRAHLRLLPEPGEPAGTAGDVMTRCAVTATPGMDASDAAAVMLKHRIKSLPVVDSGRLVGVVSRSDLLRALSPDDDQIARMVHARLAEYAGPALPWTVEVREGVVTVRGAADPEQQRVAELLARTVPGVVRVHSRPDVDAPRPLLQPD